MPQPSIHLTKAGLARRHMHGLILSRAVLGGPGYDAARLAQIEATAVS